MSDNVLRILDASVNDLFNAAMSPNVLFARQVSEQLIELVCRFQPYASATPAARSVSAYVSCALRTALPRPVSL